MDTFLFFGYAGVYLLLLAVGVRLARRFGWATSANVVLLVLVGLIYDNLVVASGRLIGEGGLLQILNLARYWLHAFLTPLLVVFAWTTLVRAGVRWAAASITRYGAFALVVILVILELVTEVIGTNLVPEREYGVLSYTHSTPETGPPLMVLVVALVLLVSSIFVLRAQRWPWFLAGAGLMIVGSAVPLPVESAAATNAFELILLTSLLATKSYQDHRESNAAREG